MTDPQCDGPCTGSKCPPGLCLCEYVEPTTYKKDMSWLKFGAWVALALITTALLTIASFLLDTYIP